MRLTRTLVGSVAVATALLALPQTATAATAAGPLPTRPLPLTAAPAGGAPARSQAATGSGPVCWFGACYDYVSGRQRTDAAVGATVRMLQSDPGLKPGDTDSHSLQELAVQSADQKSTVEIGWTVDLGLNGDTLPHLFVYHWVDGAESCYNGCGFVPVSRTVKPGMAVQPGTAARFSILNVAGDWWVFYDEHAVGYFPGSLWGGGYTRAQIITAFGEVAHAAGATCEEMGDGRFGSQHGSGWIADYHLFGSADPSRLTVTSTSPALYDPGDPQDTSFRLGGPGSGPC